MIRYAKDSDNGKPTLIVCKTIIGKGIDEIAGTCAAHGEAGVKYQDSAREALGLPKEKWYVSPETYSFFANHKKELVGKYDKWMATYNAWKGENAALAQSLEDAIAGKVPDLDKLIPTYKEAGKGIATRNAGAEVLQPIAQSMPFYVSGSADLHGSNKNYMKGVGDFSKSNYAGRNFYYGIREHGMGAIMNGMAFYGGVGSSTQTRNRRHAACFRPRPCSSCMRADERARLALAPCSPSAPQAACVSPARPSSSSPTT